VVLEEVPYAEAMLRRIQAFLTSRMWKDERGQDMVEYALMAGFITVAVAATFPPVGGGLTTIFSRVASLLSASV
jgi:Flp pilus assembly pilin Flp